jgi:general secretion pathway protein C
MRPLLLLMLVACGAPAAAPAEPEPITSESAYVAPPAAAAAAEPDPEPEPETEAEAPPEPTGCDRTWQDVTPLAVEVVDDALTRGLVEVTQHHRKVDPSLAAFALANLDAWPSKGARVTPSIKNGKPNGIKVYAVRPSSTLAQLGLKNGDTLHAINGHALAMDSTRCVIEAALQASNVVVEITRRGKPIKLTFAIQ